MDNQNISEPTAEQPPKLDPSIFFGESQNQVVNDTETEDLPDAQDEHQQTPEEDASDTDDTVDHDNTTDFNDDEESDTVDVFIVNGKEYTADRIAELEKGYERQGDYTKKTQEAADKRKEAEQLITVLSNNVTRLEATINEFEQDITEAEKQLNDDLLDEDSTEYLKLERKLAKQRQRLNKAVEQLKDAKQQQDLAEKLDKSKAFNARFPDLQDPNKRQALFDKWEKALNSIDIPLQQADKQGYEFFVVLDALTELQKQVASTKRVKKVTKVSKSVKKKAPQPEHLSIGEVFYGKT